MIFPAMKTGKLTIFTGAMARELITDGSGKVTAVSYVDKATRTEKQIRCRAVVVAASACESARLLLNSKSARFPNGIANSSGQVGRNLTDTVGYGLSGHDSGARRPAASQLRRHRRHARLRAVVAAATRRTRIFRAAITSRSAAASACRRSASFHGACERHEGYGKQLKEQIRAEYGTSIGLAGRGEMIPNEHTYCEIDPHDGGPVGHSGAALPLPLERARDQAGETHAPDLR